MSSQPLSLPVALALLERSNSGTACRLLEFVGLLSRIISKAIQCPSDPRWRRFKCDSPQFKQKIAALTEWRAVLNAMNFVPQWQDDRDAMQGEGGKDEDDWTMISLMVMREDVTAQQLTEMHAQIDNIKNEWNNKYNNRSFDKLSSSSSSSTFTCSSSSSSSSFSSSSSASAASSCGALKVLDNDEKQFANSSPPQLAPVSSTSISSGSSSVGNKNESIVSLSGEAFDAAVECLIAMGFRANESADALRRHGKLERAASELGKSSQDAESLELAHRLELEENERNRRQSFRDEQLAKQVAEQMAREEEYRKKEREERRKMEEMQSEEFIRDLHARQEREKKDGEVARKLVDEKLTLELLEEQFLRGEKLPLPQHNVRLLWSADAADKTYACGICYEDWKIAEVQVIDCDKKHIFCTACMENFIKTEIANGKLQIVCPNAVECKHELTFAELSYTAPRAQLERLNQLLTNHHLESDQNVRWCPKRGCGVPMIGDPDSRMMICPNRSCRAQFCFRCKTEEWHSGSTCENFQKWKEENSQADVRFEDWKKKNTKDCPSCRKTVEKNGGCDHMTCRCGHEFYWSTLQPYR